MSRVTFAFFSFFFSDDERVPDIRVVVETNALYAVYECTCAPFLSRDLRFDETGPTR